MSANLILNCLHTGVLVLDHEIWMAEAVRIERFTYRSERGWGEIPQPTHLL